MNSDKNSQGKTLREIPNWWGQLPLPFPVGWVVSTVLLLAIAAPNGQALAAGHVPGRLLVKPKDHVPESSVQGVFSANRIQQEGSIPAINVRLVRIPEARLLRVLTALRNNAKFEFVEPDYIVEPALTPNDTYYSLEWHLTKIQAPQAWDITTGGPDVIVAILDSGVDGAHPDLASQMVAGWNFNDNNSNTADVTGHGTAVAGTAVGCGNNGAGVAPLTWGCKIMPLRVSDTSGSTTYSLIAAAITYAADHGARVANASFLISGTSSTLSSAAQYLQSKGGVFTGSAGNEGIFDSSPDDPYILRVSATEATDVIASYSSTGNNIDLCAPGSAIVTTTKGGGYGNGTGTSFAAPIVAGVAALVISANPALTGAQVQDILKQTADDLGTPDWDPAYGWGRVNAFKAVQAAVNAGTSDTLPPSAAIASPQPGATVSGTVAVQVNATDDVGVAHVELYVDASLAGTASSGSASFSWNTTAAANGAHALLAKAYDAAGNVGTSTTDTVTVQNTVPDTALPSVAITAPSNGSTVSGVTSVAVSATDNVGVTKVELYLDGVLAGSSTSATATFSWDTKTVANGSHTLQAKASDAAGNTGASALVTVTVNNTVPDTTPPTVAITQPTAGTVVGKSTAVSVVASDNVAVVRVDLLVDGKKYATSSSATPTFTWNTSKLKRGTHTLQSVAYDAAGNSARSSVVSVTK